MQTKAKKLREKIIKYLIQKNRKAKLSEKGIASYFKVSRTPVREILKYLEYEGIIETKKKGGIKFKEFSKKEIKDMYDVRALLEAFAIKEGIKNIKREDIKELKEYAKMYNKARKQGDILKGEKADKLFHKKIIELSGNKYLIYLIEKIHLFDTVFKAKLKGNEFYYPKYDLNPNSHTKIIKAILKGDPDFAEEVIRNHILWARDKIIKTK